MAKPQKQKPKPFLGHIGITLSQWRSDAQRLAWAQQEPIFREILAVVQNESYVAMAPIGGHTENRTLGRVEGYAMALEVLMQMTQKIPKAAPQIDPTYEAETPEEQKQRKADVYD